MILIAIAFLFVAVPVHAEAHREATITKQRALSIATNELRRQKFVLPRGYEAKITESALTPDGGPKVDLVSATFYAGRQAHNLALYLVSIDRTNGTVLLVDDLTAHSDMTPPPSAITVRAALGIATKAIQERALVLPAHYKTDVIQSTVSYRNGSDKHVFIITFKIKGRNVQKLYKVAINRFRGNVEFVFDVVAGTIE